MVEKFNMDKYTGYSGPDGPYFRIHTRDKRSFVIVKKNADLGSRCVSCTGYWENDVASDGEPLECQVFVPWDNVSFIENLLYKPR